MPRSKKGRGGRNNQQNSHHPYYQGHYPPSMFMPMPMTQGGMSLPMSMPHAGMPMPMIYPQYPFQQFMPYPYAAAATAQPGPSSTTPPSGVAPTHPDPATSLMAPPAAEPLTQPGPSSASSVQSHPHVDLPDELPESDDEVSEAEARERILAELEDVPREMMASVKDVKRLKKEAESILKIVKTPKCIKHLRSIAYGEFLSDRHDEYLMSGMLMSGQGPCTLFDELRNDLLATIDKHCGKHNPIYQISVLLPEAIIYGAKILFKMSPSQANDYFENSSKFVATSA